MMTKHIVIADIIAAGHLRGLAPKQSLPWHLREWVDRFEGGSMLTEVDREGS